MKITINYDKFSDTFVKMFKIYKINNLAQKNPPFKRADNFIDKRWLFGAYAKDM